MPKITLLFTALHVVLMITLLVPISRHRYGKHIGLGDGGDEALMRKIRVHGNFVEHVPIALLLLGLLELCGMPATALWVFGGVLLLARVMHALGLSRATGKSIGRFYGTALTWLDLLAMALAGVWLALVQL